MPCRSDHLDATAIERAGSRVYQLLDIVKGKRKEIDPSAWDGYDPRAYGKIDEANLNKITDALCSHCKAMGERKMKTMALELQMWWRDHQAADAKRYIDAEVKKKQEAARRRALRKLTPADRKVLGV